MYHSIIIYVDGRFIDTWDDWHLIPSSRPVIAPPQERTKFVTVEGRDGVLDYSQTLAGKAVFDNRSGSLEFYVENDYWDWETAYTTICETLQGKRVKLALEDNPGHYYEGLLYVSKWDSDKGHSKITLKYDLAPAMQTLELRSLDFASPALRMTPGMVTDLYLKALPSDTFYRKVKMTTEPVGIVRLTENGLVEAIQNGNAVIRAVCGPMVALCRVTVEDAVLWNVNLDAAGCTQTNHTNKIQNGSSYQNDILAADGMEFLHVYVRMGDSPAGTVTMAKDRRQVTISIPEVNGDISIVATVAEIVYQPVTYDLDYVVIPDRIWEIRDGETVTLAIQSAESRYLLKEVTVTVDGTAVPSAVTWKNLCEAEVTVTATGPIVIKASAITDFALNDCPWEMIERIASSGEAAKYFRPGDRKRIFPEGWPDHSLFLIPKEGMTVRVDISGDLEAFILGIDHNPDIEGTGRIQFGMGKMDANLVSMADNCPMNPEGGNGAFGDSWLYVHVLNSAVLSALPLTLRVVLAKTPKMTYNTTAKKLETVEELFWLPSEYEIFGTTSKSAASEKNGQAQYEYFKMGNRTALYATDGTTKTAQWLRSPYPGNNWAWCKVTAAGAVTTGAATDGCGVLVCFAVGGQKNTDETE